MAGKLQPLDAEQRCLGLGAEFGGQARRAFGQQRAEALAPRRHFDQLQDRLGVPEAERPPDLGLGEQAALEALVGEGQGHAHGDGVDADVVAQFAGLDDHFDVRILEHRPEGVDRFPFRDLGVGAGEASLRDLDVLAAGDGTDEAGRVLVPVLLLQALARHPLRQVPGLVAEVARADGAQLVEEVGEHGGSILGEAGGAGAHFLAVIADVGLELGLVGEGGAAGALDGDRLELFGAHHRAHAAAPGDALAVLPVVAGAGEAHQVFPGRADGQHVGLGALDGLNGLHRLAHRLAGEAAGRAEVGAVLVDDQVARFLGAPGDHQKIEPGALEGRREAAAEGGIVEDAGERRFGGDASAARAGNRRVVPGPRRQHQDVVLGQGIDVGGKFVEQDARREPVAAQELARHPFVEGLRHPLPARQVDPEEPPMISAAHDANRPSRCSLRVRAPGFQCAR